MHVPQQERRLGLAVLAISGLLSATMPPVARADRVLTAGANLELVGQFDLPGTTSVRFSSRKPLAYAYARQDKGVVVTLDITDPARPRELGRVAVPASSYMEDMDLGERPDGQTFVLVRAEDEGLQIVDVSRPKDPRISGKVPEDVHTWTCVTRECYHAYGNMSGSSIDEFLPTHTFPIVDLTNPKNPSAEITRITLDYGFHDWNSDAAGIMWGAGRNGVYAFDVTSPRRPLLLNSSDENGPYRPDNPYNDRTHLHGSMRPNAERFTPDDPDVSVQRGNVLLMSEEGNDNDCTDSFQTWHVPHLDATRLIGNPVGGGDVTPLDSWNVLEETTPGVTRPAAPDFCSVHWFDFHQDGFVALPAYGAGTRVLDVRDASRIREVGFYFAPRHHAAQSYWVPERSASGKTTGQMTELIYTADPGTPGALALLGAPETGGIKIFRATLPASGGG